MENLDAFNFDAMKEAVGDQFANTANKYGKDERFYTLPKDKDGKGAAIIRFLPDSERNMVQKMFKINTTIIKNGKRRFVNEFSPASIGQACPFQEKWQEHWNNGEKDEAKKFSRNIRYITNIKVIKDPASPENEGKIFLYDMSNTFKEKIYGLLNPSDSDRELGATPKELFNPLKGNSFRLVAYRGATGMISYDKSEAIPEVTSIYANVEEAVKDIKENSYKLTDLLKPEAFLSYDELKKKLAYVTWSETNSDSQSLQKEQVSVAEVKAPEQEININEPANMPADTNEPTQEVKAPEQSQDDAQAPKNQQADDLDSLLEGLI